MAREAPARLGEQEAHELKRRDHAADLHHEHHRVLDLHARVEFLERLWNGAADDLGVPDREIPLAARLPLFDFKCIRTCLRWYLLRLYISVCILEHLPCIHQQLFDDRSQRVRREKGERAYDQNHAD